MKGWLHVILLVLFLCNAWPGPASRGFMGHRISSAFCGEQLIVSTESFRTDISDDDDELLTACEQFDETLSPFQAAFRQKFCSAVKQEKLSRLKTKYPHPIQGLNLQVLSYT